VTTGRPLVPRVAVVSPYWHFFEPAVDGDLRADRRALLADAVADVEQHALVVLDELVDSADGVELLQARIEAADADVLLLLLTMAAPPVSTVQLVAVLPGVSVVVWACGRSGALANTVTHADIVRRGATVGTPMITSDLVAEGRSFALLDAAPRTPDANEQLRVTLAAAAVAARVRHARVGRLGTALAGYSSVDDSDARLHGGLGLQILSLPETTLAAACAEVSSADVRAWLDAYEAGYDWRERDERAVVAAVALEATMTDYRLDAGTLNCHVDAIRGAPAIGAPCFALGHATSSGRPWTCTGDVLTAITMMIASWLTGTALYHEIEAHDDVRDDFVLANSGEHDSRWAPDRPRVDRNPWWPQGVSARHALLEGDCTVLTLRRGASRHRLVVAEGRTSADELPGTGTASGRFSFAGTSGRDAWRAWVRAGAGHHSCLARGHVAPQLQQVADHLGIGCTVVTGTSTSADRR